MNKEYPVEMSHTTDFDKGIQEYAVKSQQASKDATIEDLSRKLEEARGRIGELEQERDREKKLHHQANTMRIQQMDRDSARIASLQSAITKITEATQAYLPPDGIPAKDCLSQILEVLDKLVEGKSDGLGVKAGSPEHEMMEFLHKNDRDRLKAEEEQGE